MNIKRWTIDERMRLPDFCFGNRQVISVSKTASGPAAFSWAISDKGLPDPACIWVFGVLPRRVDNTNNYCRVSLGDTLPTNEAEMNATQPVLPQFGALAWTPPRIYPPTTTMTVWQFDLRKGMVTGGKKLILECYASIDAMAAIAFIVVSELPTNISGWLAHSFFTKVR